MEQRERERAEREKERAEMSVKQDRECAAKVGWRPKLLVRAWESETLDEITPTKRECREMTVSILASASPIVRARWKRRMLFSDGIRTCSLLALLPRSHRAPNPAFALSPIRLFREGLTTQGSAFPTTIRNAVFRQSQSRTPGLRQFR